MPPSRSGAAAAALLCVPPTPAPSSSAPPSVAAPSVRPLVMLSPQGPGNGPRAASRPTGATSQLPNTTALSALAPASSDNPSLLQWAMR
eukprot:14204258-Alexandrium_andersonii.AAC.1